MYICFTILGCGPNIAVMYTNSLMFEHCFSLDLYSNVNTEDKLMCWHTWIDHHAVGQNDNRLQYAWNRIIILTQKEKVKLLS